MICICSLYSEHKGQLGKEGESKHVLLCGLAFPIVGRRNLEFFNKGSNQSSLVVVPPPLSVISA